MALNVLFLREHNRVAGVLAAAHPDWDDERLFQTTRNTLIVLMIRVMLEEYINHITPYHFGFVLDPVRTDRGVAPGEPGDDRVQPRLPLAQPDPVDVHDRG
ncbi:peroxidase family protein [Streptomyces nogalater]